MKCLNYHSVETGRGARQRMSCVLLLCLAFAFLPVTRVSAFTFPMPGSVPGFSLNFTISEPSESGDETTQENPLVITFNLPPGASFAPGFLLMSEPGTVADPTDPNHVNWSDVVFWQGNTATFYSDPPTGGWPNLSGENVVLATEVPMGPNNTWDGVTYYANVNDGSGNITTWTIISDVPEPGTGCLMGLGLLVWRLLRKKSA